MHKIWDGYGYGYDCDCDCSLSVADYDGRADKLIGQPAIRWINPTQDLCALKKLLSRSHVVQSNFDAAFHANPRGECVVAIHNARVIAAMAVGPSDRESRCEHYRRPGIAVLLAHAVETGQQGCSANRAMLNFVCRYLGAQGYMQLAIDVPEAAVGLLDTYRRCGFKYVDAFFREGEVLERIVLSRPHHDRSVGNMTSAISVSYA